MKMDDPLQADEEVIINAFMTSIRRERWLTSLKNPSRRRAILDRLNHCRDFDGRYARLLPPQTDVIALLRKRGAGNVLRSVGFTSDRWSDAST